MTDEKGLMVIIEFPKKYSVIGIGAGGMFAVAVPDEYADALLALIKQQPWVSASWFVLPSNKTITCIVSRAYDVTDEQAQAALCRLCEHVMSPPVEVDMAVWGDALDGCA